VLLLVVAVSVRARMVSGSLLLATEPARREATTCCDDETVVTTQRKRPRHAISTQCNEPTHHASEEKAPALTTSDLEANEAGRSKMHEERFSRLVPL
jgi:hypothetical protein